MRRLRSSRTTSTAIRNFFAMSSIDVSDTLAQLTASLVSVSTALTPLLATSLEQLAEDGIDPLEKAKLEVTMAYVVHDLIWSEFRNQYPIRVYLWPCVQSRRERQRSIRTNLFFIFLFLLSRTDDELARTQCRC